MFGLNSVGRKKTLVLSEHENAKAVLWNETVKAECTCKCVRVKGVAFEATPTVQEEDNDSLLQRSGRRDGGTNSWKSYFRDRIGRK